MQTKNKLRAITLILSVVLPVFLVGAVVFAVTTVSGTTITLENSATIANSTAGQVDVGGLSSPAGGANGLYAVNTLDAAADLTGELIGGRFAANSNAADTSASGSVKGVMSQARARLPSGTAGAGVFELTAFYGSADAKDSPDVDYLRGIEVSLDGLVGSTATLAQGVLISNNSSGAQTTSYALDINSGTASGHAADIRLQNGETIANATDGGVVIASSSGAIAGGNSNSSNPLLKVDADTDDVANGVRQGALFIGLNRPSTNALTSWDGNPDCALKIQAYNRAANGSDGGTRGIDVNARNRDSGTESWINTIYATAENSANTIDTSTVGEFHMKNNGVVSTAHYGVLIQDDSQGTSSGATYGLYIYTANYNPGGGRDAAIQINSQNTSGWTNGVGFDGVITNALNFADTDGTGGAKEVQATMDGDVADALIKIDIGGTAYYIPAFNAAGITGEW
jgi:hypothetical protein